MCRYAPFVTLRNEGSLIEHGFLRCSNTLIKWINTDLVAALLFSRGEEEKGDNVSLCSVCHPEERRVS